MTGGGSYAIGDSVTLTATATPGYWFTGWSEGGTIVSTLPTYTFTITGNRALAASFELYPQLNIAPATSNVFLLKWPESATGWILQESSDLKTWINSTRPVTQVNGENTVNVSTNAHATFFRLSHP